MLIVYLFCVRCFSVSNIDNKLIVKWTILEYHTVIIVLFYMYILQSIKFKISYDSYDMKVIIVLYVYVQFKDTIQNFVNSNIV